MPLSPGSQPEEDAQPRCTLTTAPTSLEHRESWPRWNSCCKLLKPETASQHNINWSFSPSRAPHFGGLWEAGVKSMKTLLNKIVDSHHLSFEELSTVLIESEATLNSRPLMPVDSTPSDGTPILTPGHFLIGRPLRALPTQVDTTSKESTLRRWNLVKRLSADPWTRWIGAVTISKD